MASVSVVIPCYRYGHFLHDCIGSALRDQPGVDVRVLVIDDASPDDSADVARSIAAAASGRRASQPATVRESETRPSYYRQGRSSRARD